MGLSFGFGLAHYHWRLGLELFARPHNGPGIRTDRYNGYNKLPVEIQYCYAHLLRTVKDLEKDFPLYCPIISRIITIGYETEHFRFAGHFS